MAKMRKLVRRVLEVVHHRNGISGEGFYVVKFVMVRQPEDEQARNMVGIVFDDEKYVAVFDLDKLGKGHIGFGFGKDANSWRGDHFEGELRLAIDKDVAEKQAAITQPKGK